jgi:hypothetical protein
MRVQRFLGIRDVLGHRSDVGFRKSRYGLLKWQYRSRVGDHIEPLLLSGQWGGLRGRRHLNWAIEGVLAFLGHDCLRANLSFLRMMIGRIEPGLEPLLAGYLL